MVLEILKASGSINSKNDSLSKNYGFHILCSINPLIKRVNNNDSLKHLFYSAILPEVQFSYKRHVLGFGFNRTLSRTTSESYGFPNEAKNKSYTLTFFYSYKFYSSKRVKLYSGLSYIYYKNDKLNILHTKIETITKGKITLEKGVGAFLRMNYAFNKHFSAELESAVYLLHSDIYYKEDYPLTPSMSIYSKILSKNNTDYALVSNLLLKFTF